MEVTHPLCPILGHPCWFSEVDVTVGSSNPPRALSLSATYQKITPVSVPKEPLEPGSSYSITLYIGEQAMPRARCHSFVATPGSPREVLGERGQGPPPRPKNKSVFKKFFGKKE